jgi:hypothetical protein
MVEPTFKRRKDWGVKTENDVRPKSLEDPLRFTTTHRYNPTEVDLTEFAVGMQTPRIGGKRRWNGNFSGRRALILELAPFIRVNRGNAPKNTITTMMNALRIWWRLLDKYQDIAPVTSVRDIGDIHGAMQMRDGVSSDVTSGFLNFVNAVREEHGLGQLVWVKNPRKTPISDLPGEKEVAAIYNTLKRKVYETIDRWSAFDALAGTGNDWSQCMERRPQNLKWTLADTLATFQGIASHANHPCPSRSACVTHLGLKTKGSKFFKHYPEVIYGLYPSRSDVQNVLLMIMLRAGWNGETAVAIDCLNLAFTIRDHPTSKAHSILYSIKGRGNTEQPAHGLKRSDLSPANLVMLLVTRSKLLREQLASEFALMESHVVAAGMDDKSFLRISTMRSQLASAWVFVERDDSVISALTKQNYSLGQDGKKSAMLCLIQDTNCANVGVNVRESVVLSDTRDAFISFAYKYSDFSWLETQLAAGHTSVNSLLSYLRKRQWKAHGEKRVAGLFDSFWNEIKTRRIADPAVLRALADRGEISEEQRERWLKQKDRTYVGMGCRNFKRPPKSIAPEHIDGTGCRVQRCTLCELGVVFEDSVDHLARRLAELAHIKRTIPLNSWYHSSFPLEVVATELALKSFDPKLVEARVLFWEGEIREGRHVPLSMEGSYGTKS